MNCCNLRDASSADCTIAWLYKANATLDESSTVFTCTDNHLIEHDYKIGKYSDNTYGSNLVMFAPRTGIPANGVRNACAGQVEAFTYSTGTHVVVVLCSDWPGSAMKSYLYVDMTPWRNSFNADSTIGKGQGINLFSISLVYKIAHELMHATDMVQCQYSL